jgi:predicted RNase H-like HicB family nuclease
MKIIVKKEFDGKYYIGSCENLPSCYAQSESSEKLLPELRKAIELYRKSYLSRSQSLPNSFDTPVIDRKIRFNKISTSQLVKILERNSYHIESKDNDAILLINSNYPFNRIHIPDTDELSPMIVSKIFGKENIIYLNKNQLRINSSA